MRSRQAELPFGDTRPEEVLYGLQAVRNGETYVAVELFPTMAKAAERLLVLLAAEWPTEVASSLCSQGFGAQMLMVELEHPTAPWLQFKVCRFVGTRVDADLGDIPDEEARAFSERMTRTLEYTYPGLLVANSLRSNTLSPDYYLCPHVLQLSTGYKTTCWGDMELLPVLDGLGVKPTVKEVAGVLRLDTDEGLVELALAWTSNADASSRIGGLAPEQVNGLLNRMARLRRLTDGPITQLLARVMAGPHGADNCFPVNKDAIEVAMRAVNFSPKQLALLAEVPLNVVQRILKYGYAHETLIPKLAAALGLDHPNELLPPEKDQGTGIRIEDGAVFLRALKQTHVWRRVIGEGLLGKELDKVTHLAEALQDYVEVLQFRTGPFGKHVQDLDELEQPVDEASLARTVQELLDELTEMEVAVVVSTDIRFAGGSGRLKDMRGMPLHHGTLFFERVSMLKSPRARSAEAT
ncbi:hypothetical protein BN948_05080 [Hydrogenophaga intermedia]|uniref:Uncharacterized protein n=2 Tax=Hydrogenophaga intermedia TaxID=65786 RepID=A0A1L1PZG2_HYDIT|nr:hypothetical protein [Hydrogenophaga intermedia]CDN90635.1 hypothetical protein BN948_05080 [Hydrogenophaga intermedia]